MSDVRDFEAATQAELEPLFNTLKDWLFECGVSQSGVPPEAYGMYDGLYVFDEGISHDVQVSGNAIRDKLPEAAAHLAIGSHLLISLTDEYYAPSSDDQDKTPFYIGPVVDVHIFKEDGAGDDTILAFGPEIDIDLRTADGSWGSDRQQPLSDISLDQTQSAAELDRDAIADYLFRQLMGLGQMTVGECAALQQIADNLGVLTS